MSLEEKNQYLETEVSSGAPTPLKSTSLAEEDEIVPYEELSPAEKKGERRFVSLAI